MEEPKYIPHLKQNTENSYDWSFQSNDEHQQGVGELALKFTAAFGCSKLGYILGMLHDIGKEQHDFQQYIRKCSGYKPEIKNAHKTPHAYVGALVARKLYSRLYPILSMPIAGHHVGLYDSLDFEDKMKEQLPLDIQLPQLQDVDVSELLKKLQPQDFNHFIRVLFSSLVDADYLDTERFMNVENFNKRRNHNTLSELIAKLELFLEDLSAKAPKTELNELRAQIQEVCLKESEGLAGFYSLTVPTGGGKTLSSLLWAMKHAVRYGKERIIIAIPYTSIIVQTAATLRKIFGDENVCEHHSNFDP